MRLKITTASGGMQIIDNGGRDDNERVIRPGDRLRIEPPNPASKRHRGRECFFVDYLPYKQDGQLRQMKIRFADNGRIGRVDFWDLVPVERSECHNTDSESDPV